MAYLWIVMTLMAALMQSIRTAAQRGLSLQMSAFAASTARYIYGLPFVVVYALTVLPITDISSALNWQIFVYASIAGWMQILATVALIMLLNLRNFAVGTSYSKTEILFTAVIGTLLFAQPLGWYGWLGTLLSSVGIFSLAAYKSGKNQSAKFSAEELLLGLAAGLGFALTALFGRQCALSFVGFSYIEQGSATLLIMIVVQSISCLLYMFWRQRGELLGLLTPMRAKWFVGVTSAIGSIGWFTAAAAQKAAYVRVLGQVEFVFALLITVFYFKESVSRAEYAAMTVVLIGVLVLMLDTF